MLHQIFVMIFWLLVGHFACDYPLQGDFLAQGKNRHTPIGKNIWPQCLFAHSMIHAGAVAFITGNIWLGLIEGVCHALTDWFKCENKISYNADQFIHIGCKIVWALLAVFFIVT